MAPKIAKKPTGKTGNGLTAKSSGRTIKNNMNNLAPKPASAGTSRPPGHNRQGSLTSFVPPVTASKTYSNTLKNTPRPVTTKIGRFYTTPVMNTLEPRKSRFGILWLPIKKRNKNKDVVYNSHKANCYRERASTMYNMSGDSTESRQAKKDEEFTSLALEKIRAQKQVAPVASVSTATDTSDIISSLEDIKLDDKSSKIETDDTDNKTGDNEEQKFLDDIENKSQENTPVAARKGRRNIDKVDGVKFSPTNHSDNEQEPDCGIACLHCTLKFCDCVII